MTSGFLFATGIENSIPTIHDGRLRMDELDKCGHYRHWETDFALVSTLGLSFLRYGPPLHRTFLGPGRYDWEFCDRAFNRLRELRIVPIVDLCHFGMPDWLGSGRKKFWRKPGRGSTASAGESRKTRTSARIGCAAGLGG